MIKNFIIKFLKFIRVIPKSDLTSLKNLSKQVKESIQHYWNEGNNHPDNEHYKALWGQLYGVIQIIENIHPEK